MVAMRLFQWVAAAAVLGALALGGAGPALAADPFVSVGDELAVGTNRTGEACRLTAAPDGGLGGQSLSGLARAFFYAGARSLLVSHWAVASQPTVILTTSLFEAYTRDATLGRAAALRTAQAKLQGDPATSHPAFWAPFVLVGDGGQP
jgi:hypothetical protein